MKNIFTGLSIFLSFYTCEITRAQTAADYAVQLNATVQETPARIRLDWKSLPGATSHTIYRKTAEDLRWGTAIATLGGSDTVYTDSQVTTDTAYEYRVVKDGGIKAYGYIYAGLSAPAIHDRGRILLLVDSLFTDSCSSEIYQLMEDLSADGWQPLRRDVSRAMPDTSVRSMILVVDQAYGGLTAVMLLGHIAVPYSGNMNPDGHPDHLGAWPADVYYATRTGNWTDGSVNSTSASQARNQNVPGDGKWDQSSLPADAEFEVSRIDFHDMPAFHKTEVQLMKNYLDRAHRYKMDSLEIEHRALIDDNFGAFSGEAFAGNGWRNFSPLTGRNKIFSADLISSLRDSSFQWAYGCGGGTYRSASGIGNTDSFAANPVNGIFTMMFGSYFGDWDVQNSFLRAPLCAETPALTSAWAGRPHWHLHHMALGRHIGYSTRLSQNNIPMYNTYIYNFFPSGVHIALMGDLSLRTDYIRPVERMVVATIHKMGAQLGWVPSPDSNVTGYYVYRSDSLFGRYERLSEMLLTTTFWDTVGSDGMKYYMVRPVSKTTTPSGTYFNLGLGIKDSAPVTYPVSVQDPAGVRGAAVSLYPNPVKNLLHADFTVVKEGMAVCQIIDITGRRMGEYRIPLHQGRNTASFATGHLSPGLYTLQVRMEDQAKAFKFLKGE